MHLNQGNGYLEQNKKGRLNGVHRFIMEEFLGRQLEYNEVVHHKNHNKQDNRLENLEVLSRAEHTKIHAKRAERVPKNCPNCKKDFLVLPSQYRYSLRRKSQMFCSRQCSGIFNNQKQRGVDQ